MSDPNILPRQMTIDEFEPLVGEWMLADCEPEPVKIKLIEASLSSTRMPMERPPFVLVFHTPPHVHLMDGGYVVRCGDFGPDIIHISSLLPPHRAEPGFYYQAVFN